MGPTALAVNMPVLVRREVLEKVVVERAPAVAGGVLLIFGAHLADGCPSGHGISGLATFSMASFVTVAAMFGGGIVVKALIG